MRRATGIRPGHLHKWYKQLLKYSFFFFFLNFADDTNLLHMDNNLKNLEKTFNKELAKVSRWLIANKLTLNISKSNFVIFRPYQKQITYQPTFKLFDNNSQLLVALECKTYIEYLGVSINQHLGWKHHIDHIAQRISKAVGNIARRGHHVPFLYSLIYIFS